MDLLGLTPVFVLKIMQTAVKENRFLVYPFDDFEPCEHCIDYEDQDGDFWEQDGRRLMIHPIGPENIRLVEVRYVKSDDCTHAVTVSYTNGTGHFHRDGNPVDRWAEYGVNEEFDIIELWAS